MAIFTRWGSDVEVVARCGRHRPGRTPEPLILVRVRYATGGHVSYQFATDLRADGGAGEVDAAVDAAPEVTLTPAELAAAMAQAE